MSATASYWPWATSLKLHSKESIVCGCSARSECVTGTQLCTKASFYQHQSWEKISKSPKVLHDPHPPLPARCLAQSLKEPLAILKLHKLGSQRVTRLGRVVVTRLKGSNSVPVLGMRLIRKYLAATTVCLHTFVVEQGLKETSG